MDKISKIVAAAILASAISHAAPAIAATTTAEQFVVGLSSDFSDRDYTTIVAKLNELKQLGFEGILFDTDQMVSIDQLLLWLQAAQNGQQDAAGIAAMLLAWLEDSEIVRFIGGGTASQTADLTVDVASSGPGLVFPAGSAG